MRRIGWLVVAAVAIVAGVLAATASRPPATESERAYELKQATLCPVCDGQSVLESNAPAAAAMRRQIDLWVDAGRSDSQIRADLAAAYGDDVNALPPGQGIGTLVWALPVAAFAAAAAGLWAATRRWKLRAAAAGAPDDGAELRSSRDIQEHSGRTWRGAPQGGAESRLSGAGPGVDNDAEPSLLDDGPGSRSAAERSGGEPRAKPARLVSVATITALVLVGALAGVLVARSAGLRLSGETLTGDIDRSARSLLVDAQRHFAANQLDESRATLEEIFRLDPDLRGALVLSARLHLRHCEVLLSQDQSEVGEALGAPVAGCDLLSALEDLDRVLAEDRSDTEALALRGWLLVSILDDVFIALLDDRATNQDEIDDVRDLIDEGIESLDEAVALDPGEFDPWVFRGYTARFIEGDLSAAIGYYQAALQRDPPPAMAAALETAIAEMQAELE